ncbi:MAG: hypothetical protein LBD75_02740 [Candidatus Peribacteria bacterium]|jgi:hypothetical protein|nr:hypothetical protein [Candidatus Peribacteria bacterium]
MFIILGTALFSEGITTFWSVFSLFVYFWFGFLGFLVFIIGMLYPINNNYGYQLFLMLGLVIITVLINTFASLGIGLLISLCLLSLYYVATYLIKKRKMPQKETSILSVRRILAGERIHKKHSLPQWKAQLHEWIITAPLWFQRGLELPNLLLLVGVITCYLYTILKMPNVTIDLWYWISLAVFLINIFLLKKIQYVSNISRFALALVVNFALYSALLKS